MARPSRRLLPPLLERAPRPRIATGVAKAMLPGKVVAVGTARAKVGISPLPYRAPREPRPTRVGPLGKAQGVARAVITPAEKVVAARPPRPIPFYERMRGAIQRLREALPARAPATPLPTPMPVPTPLPVAPRPTPSPTPALAAIRQRVEAVREPVPAPPDRIPSDVGSIRAEVDRLSPYEGRLPPEVRAKYESLTRILREKETPSRVAPGVARARVGPVVPVPTPIPQPEAISKAPGEAAVPPVVKGIARAKAVAITPPAREYIALSPEERAALVATLTLPDRIANDIESIRAPLEKLRPFEDRLTPEVKARYDSLTQRLRELEAVQPPAPPAPVREGPEAGLSPEERAAMARTPEAIAQAQAIRERLQRGKEAVGHWWESPLTRYTVRVPVTLAGKAITGAAQPVYMVERMIGKGLIHGLESKEPEIEPYGRGNILFGDEDRKQFTEGHEKARAALVALLENLDPESRAKTEREIGRIAFSPPESWLRAAKRMNYPGEYENLARNVQTGEMVQILPGGEPAEGWKRLEMWDQTRVTQILIEEEHMGLELLGQVICDPLNLVPVSWLGKARFGKEEGVLAGKLVEAGQITEAERFLEGAQGLTSAKRVAHLDFFSEAVLRVPLTYADEFEESVGLARWIKSLDTGEIARLTQVTPPEGWRLIENPLRLYPRAGSRDASFLEGITKLLRTGTDPGTEQTIRRLTREAEIAQRLGKSEQAADLLKRAEELGKARLSWSQRLDIAREAIPAKWRSTWIFEPTAESNARKLADQSVDILKGMMEGVPSGGDRYTLGFLIRDNPDVLIKDYPIMGSKMGRRLTAVFKHGRADEWASLLANTALPGQKGATVWEALHGALTTVVQTRFFPTPARNPWQRFISKYIYPLASRAFLSNPRYAERNILTNFVFAFADQGPFIPKTPATLEARAAEWMGDAGAMPRAYSRGFTLAAEVTPSAGAKALYPRAGVAVPTEELMGVVKPPARQQITKWTPYVGAGYQEVSIAGERYASKNVFLREAEAVYTDATSLGKIGRWLPDISKVEPDPAIAEAIEEIVRRRRNIPAIEAEIEQLYNVERVGTRAKYVSTERLRALGDQGVGYADMFEAFLSEGPSKASFRRYYKTLIKELDQTAADIAIAETVRPPVALPRVVLEGLSPEELKRIEELRQLTGTTSRNYQHIAICENMVFEQARRSGLSPEEALDIIQRTQIKANMARGKAGWDADALRAYWAENIKPVDPSAWPAIDAEIHKIYSTAWGYYDEAYIDAYEALGGERKAMMQALTDMPWGPPPKNLMATRMMALQDDLINASDNMRVLEKPLAPETMGIPEFENIGDLRKWVNENPTQAENWLGYMRGELRPADVLPPPTVADEIAQEAVEQIITPPEARIPEAVPTPPERIPATPDAIRAQIEALRPYEGQMSGTVQAQYDSLKKILAEMEGVPPAPAIAPEVARPVAEIAEGAEARLDQIYYAGGAKTRELEQESWQLLRQVWEADRPDAAFRHANELGLLPSGMGKEEFYRLLPPSARPRRFLPGSPESLERFETWLATLTPDQQKAARQYRDALEKWAQERWIASQVTPYGRGGEATARQAPSAAVKDAQRAWLEAEGWFYPPGKRWPFVVEEDAPEKISSLRKLNSAELLDSIAPPKTWAMRYPGMPRPVRTKIIQDSEIIGQDALKLTDVEGKVWGETRLFYIVETPTEKYIWVPKDPAFRGFFPGYGPGTPMAEDFLPPSLADMAGMERDMLKPRLEEYYKEIMAAWDEPVAALPENFVNVRKFLDDEFIPAYRELKMYAAQRAEAARDFALFSYRKSNLDMLLTHAYFWPYWTTRAGYTWMIRFLEHPWWLSDYAKLRAAHRQLNADLPANYQDTIVIPDMLGLGIDLAVNPYLTLGDPVYQFLYSLEHLGPELRRVGPLGFFTGAPISPILGLEQLIDPMETEDKEAVRIGPISAWARALNAATGINIEAPVIEAIARAWAEVKPSIYGAAPQLLKNWMGGPEPRRVIAETEYDPTYIMRQLWDMASRGDITWDEYNEASERREGPTWEKAVAESRSTRGSAEWTSLLLNLRLRRMIPAEKEIAQAYAELEEIWALEEGAFRRDALEQYYDRWPGMRLYQMRYRPKETAEIANLTNEFYRRSELQEAKQELELAQTIRNKPGDWDALTAIKAEHRIQDTSLSSFYKGRGANIYFNPRSRTGEEIKDYVKGQILGLFYSHIPRAEQFKDKEGAIDWVAYNNANVSFWNMLPTDIVRWDDVKQMALEVRDVLGQNVNVLGLAKEVANQTAYDEWRKANDIPEEALMYAWQKYIGQGNAYYQEVLKPLDAAERDMPLFFRSYGGGPAEGFIDYILQEYPGRWTEEELTGRLKGITMPGIWESWHRSDTEEDVAWSLLWGYWRLGDEVHRGRMRDLIADPNYDRFFLFKDTRNKDVVTKEWYEKWLASVSLPSPWVDPAKATDTLRWFDLGGAEPTREVAAVTLPRAETGAAPAVPAPIRAEVPAPAPVTGRPVPLATAGEEVAYDQWLGVMTQFQNIKATNPEGASAFWQANAQVLEDSRFYNPGPTSQFWDYYYGNIPPGRIAEEIRNDPLIQAIVSRETRDYLTDEGFGEAVRRMQAWAQAHPEIVSIGNPEEWATVREIVGQWSDLRDQGRDQEAKALWKEYGDLLNKYYPSGRGSLWGMVRGRRGGGGRWASRAPSGAWETRQYFDQIIPPLLQGALADYWTRGTPLSDADMSALKTLYERGPLGASTFEEWLNILRGLWQSWMGAQLFTPKLPGTYIYRPRPAQRRY